MQEDTYQHIERTAKATPYEGIPIPPPPPKPPRKVLTWVVGMAFGCTMLLFCSALLFYWSYTYHVDTTKPTPVVVVMTPTPTLIPQTATHPYTAQDIVNEMIAYKLTVVSPQYGVSPQSFYNSSGKSFYDNVSTLPFQSSVTWITSTDPVGPYHCEDSGCTMALWVYDSPSLAATVYHDLIADAIQAIQQATGRSVTPRVTLYGRCVVDSIDLYGPTYATVIQQYCI